MWLWPWQAGLDEVLATCRTACDLPDEHEDFVFTRAGAWSYPQAELVTPELFGRAQDGSTQLLAVEVRGILEGAPAMTAR